MNTVRPFDAFLPAGATSLRARPIDALPNLSDATAMASDEGGFALVSALGGHFIASPTGDILIRATHQDTANGGVWFARGLVLVYGTERPKNLSATLPNKVTVLHNPLALDPPTTGNPLIRDYELAQLTYGDDVAQLNMQPSLVIGAGLFAVNPPRVYEPARDYRPIFVGRNDGETVALLQNSYGEFMVACKGPSGEWRRYSAEYLKNLSSNDGQFFKIDGNLGVLVFDRTSMSIRWASLSESPICQIRHNNPFGGERTNLDDVARELQIPLHDPLAVVVSLTDDDTPVAPKAVLTSVAIATEESSVAALAQIPAGDYYAAETALKDSLRAKALCLSSINSESDITPAFERFLTAVIDDFASVFRLYPGKIQDTLNIWNQFATGIDASRGLSDEKKLYFIDEVTRLGRRTLLLEAIAKDPATNPIHRDWAELESKFWQDGTASEFAGELVTFVQTHPNAFRFAMYNALEIFRSCIDDDKIKDAMRGFLLRVIEDNALVPILSEFEDTWLVEFNRYINPAPNNAVPYIHAFKSIALRPTSSTRLVGTIANDANAAVSISGTAAQKAQFKRLYEQAMNSNELPEANRAALKSLYDHWGLADPVWLLVR